MGRGSEVLGYDDSLSTDHTWFARVIVFVPGEVLAEQGKSVQAQLTARIPDLFQGVPSEVTVTTVQQYFLDQLGLDVSVAWDAYDWVSLPEQRLCAMTAGAVFHDDLDLEKVRQRLAYYPREIWLYLMLSGWWRVHPEMNLVGRVGYAGDELGSTLIASEIVSGLMHLSFLIDCGSRDVATTARSHADVYRRPERAERSALRRQWDTGFAARGSWVKHVDLGRYVRSACCTRRRLRVIARSLHTPRWSSRSQAACQRARPHERQLHLARSTLVVKDPTAS
jgi:Domain of unknown function (DUF4037)